ncbi:MAG: TonB-dependent receptor [Proteobacteria bacterium]|nr:TonB-dependent receptor [Pseudomonadota bacterium]
MIGKGVGVRVAVMAAVLICALPALADEIQKEPSVTDARVNTENQNDSTAENSEVLSPGRGEVFMNIGEVLVSGRKNAKNTVDLPGSVDILGRDQIEKEVVGNALELLRRIPGFIYRDYGNGGVPNGFTMRGFNSNHGSDNLVNVDGIPINDHFWQEDGAPDLNQLAPDEVDRIEVIKGPIDARYGNWGRAGIVNIETRKRGDFFKSHVSLGNWNTQRAYVTGGSEQDDGMYSQVYSVEYYSTDGWRDNNENKRQNAYGKWYVRPADDLQIGLQAHMYSADWFTGSYISEDQWNQDPRQAFAPSQNDGGQKDLNELSLHLDWNENGDLPVQARLWRKESTGSRYADWGDGQTEAYGDETVTGFLTNLGYTLDVSEEQRLKIDTGFDFRNYDSNVQNWNTDARVRQSINSEDDYIFRNYGLYLKTNYDPITFLRLFAGIRHDLFTGDTTDRLTGISRDMDEYNVTTYKGGIIGNITDWFSVYANVGTTFTLPKKDEKYAENHREVNDLLFTEMGLKANPYEWLLLRYAYFHSKEDVVTEIAGEYVSQGDAVRKGHEVEIDVMPLNGLQIFTSLTLDDSTFDGGSNDGNWVTSVPEYIWNMGIQYDSSFGTGARLWYRNVGKWYTDETNEHSYDGYETTDLTVYQSIAKKWILSLDVKNLFDQTYAEFVGYWSGANQYMSSNPRAFYLSMRYSI